VVLGEPEGRSADRSFASTRVATDTALSGTRLLLVEW
jgi:hypothetical protein